MTKTKKPKPVVCWAVAKGDGFVSDYMTGTPLLYATEEGAQTRADWHDASGARAVRVEVKCL